MKVSVTARHFDLTPQLREHAEARLDRFGKFTSGLVSAHVVLEIEKYRQIAEVSVHSRQGDYTGKAESGEMTVSIDGACDKVERQIRRRMDKKRAQAHNGDSREGVPMGETRIESERRIREMMTLEEATGRIEDGEELVVFADTDSGATRIVYRRADGSVKLIEVAG
jgi:putative sigma-54 modulation protein